MTAIEIVKKMQGASDREYRELFKELARITDGQGTLLWNENPIDTINEAVCNGVDETVSGQKWIDDMIELHTAQARWLTEIGLTEIADRW